MKVNKKLIEQKLGINLNQGSCLGFDTASRTGWCYVVSTEENLDIDYGFIKIESKDIDFKYQRMIQLFKQIIEEKKPDIVIIEDTFYSFNPLMFKEISRFGAIVFTLAELQGIQIKKFIGASSARKKIGIKGNSKKQDVAKTIRSLKLTIKDNDIADAIVLALCGLTGNPTVNCF